MTTDTASINVKTGEVTLSIVGTPEIPLSTIRESKKADIEKWRDETCEADVVANGTTWQADAKSQDLLNKAINLAVAGLPLPTLWRDKDNNDVLVTDLAFLLEIAGAIASQVDAAYNRSWLLKMDVDNSTTVEELELIVW